MQRDGSREALPGVALGPRRPPTGEGDLFAMGARVSPAIVAGYVLILALIVLVGRLVLPTADLWALYVLIALALFSLVRYLSTRYSLDQTYLRARTIVGGGRLALNDVRSVGPASLRALAPTGGYLASWVWRGRLLSPTIGEFVAIFTDAASGLLVVAEPFPWYISPRRPQEFARELSRRIPVRPVGVAPLPREPRRAPAALRDRPEVAPGTLLLFLGGDPDLPAMRLPIRQRYTMLERLFLPRTIGAEPPRTSPAGDPAAPWPYPVAHVMCAQRLADAARRTGRAVKTVDVNRPAEDRGLVEAFVGPDDVLPIVVRSDGARLEGAESFTPNALRRFVAAS